MENRYKLQYDIKLKNIINITFKQGDIDTSILDLTLLDNGQPVDVTGEIIEFRFLKPDNKIVFQDASAGVNILDSINGNIECILKAQTLAAVGDVTCEIHRVKDGKTLTTQSFKFTVEQSISGDGILSENYISTIDGMLIAMQQAEAIRVTNELDRIALYNEVNTKLTNGELKGEKGYKGDTGEQGVQGIQGETGAVPNIQIGTVTTLSAGSNATVIRQVGSTDENPIFNFGIPKGLDGLGAGDMVKVDYDSNNDGKVNSADLADIAIIANDSSKLGSQVPAYYAKQADLSAHLFGLISEIIVTTRDLSLSGSQIISGFTKIPKYLDIHATVPSTLKFSVGVVANNSQRCIVRTNDNLMTQIDRGIAMGETAANLTLGAVTVNADNTVTINWTLAGTGGIGTAQIRIIAHYHD